MHRFPRYHPKRVQNLPSKPNQENLTRWSISQDSVHIFQNRFLRWNRGLKPVVLSTMNPIIRRIFFRTYNGVLDFKNTKKCKSAPNKYLKYSPCSEHQMVLFFHHLQLVFMKHVFSPKIDLSYPPIHFIKNK